MKIAEQDQSATKEILKSVQSNFSTWKNILPEEVSVIKQLTHPSTLNIYFQ